MLPTNRIRDLENRIEDVINFLAASLPDFTFTALRDFWLAIKEAVKEDAVDGD